MFDRLLKSKFYSKCKSAVKRTKTRLETIKTRRSAMQMFLKKDVVDLLKYGWDTDAYGRVEGLWNELNLSSCYDLVEQYCMNILSHLATMDKQRECPEECREAASSLMFAAARFSDLPELRKLRTVFTERFGNSIEYYVNKEFVHKLKSTPPTKDMKLQLIQDIALESGIEWNSKTLEHKLYKNPTASALGADTKGLENKQTRSQIGKSDGIRQYDPIGNSQPKPKSVRRRNLKTFPGNDKVEIAGGDGSKTLSSEGINEGRKHLEIINDRQHDQQDEEERIMDRLLMHSSRKKLPHDTGESEANLKASHPAAISTGRGTKDRGKDGPPTRAASLRSVSSPAEAPKLHARASSFQPEVLNSNRHIHPKLPDYDNFVAELAALQATLR